MTEYFWDDEAFEAAVQMFAERNGETVADLLRRANVAHTIFAKSSLMSIEATRARSLQQIGRPAGVIWRIADAAGLTPEQLFAAGMGRKQ